jgi:VWD domain-containing protein
VVGLVAMLAVVTVAGACAARSTATQPGPSASGEDEWRTKLAQTPLPPSKCATATFPHLAWTVVPCTKPPEIPLVPRVPDTPRTPAVVGNGEDLSAMAPTGLINTAIGSFDSVSVSTESSPIADPSGTPVANYYTLQINTAPFTTTACSGSPNPGCRGWEQFVYWNSGSTGFGSGAIQYWLLRYNTTCPSGGGTTWNQFQFSGDTDIYCWRNAVGGSSPPNQAITNLGNLRLAGSATAGSDSVTVFVGTMAYGAPGDNSVNASTGWNTAEFNVFGYGGNSNGGTMATFNSGASVNVRTRILYGGTAAPICVAQGYTGETNNLGYTTSPPAATPPGPALMFVENTAGGSTPDCVTQATTIGDTHLHTFGGTFYDFQATGDFLLADADPDLVVQARQISSAPRWPDAAYNSAVATRMGTTRVSVCAATEAQLYVNGNLTSVTSGAAIYRDGVSITRSGNTYTIVDENGNSIRATINEGTWIDVTVGLGRWPTRVRGLLANPDNSPRQLQGSDSHLYNVPLSFEDTYQKYGESWRVKAADSLLNDCGTVSEQANPRQPFYVGNLNERDRGAARQVCLQAGVKDNAPTLLDACTLDVAVLGKPAAAVYLGAAEPAVNGNAK